MNPEARRREVVIKAHEFWGSDNEFSYGWTQTTDEIKSGDILITKSVVGFLWKAWPVAVTKEVGEFHHPDDNFVSSDWDDVRESISEAQRIARECGLVLLGEET
jgi:hypothetical protein